MINIISNTILQFFLVNNIIKNNEDKEIYLYGLELIISSLMNILALLFISVFIGRFVETAAFLAAFIPLRTYAGGYHAKTHMRCFAILLGVYSLVLLVLFYLPRQSVLIVITLFSFLSLVLTSFYAPLDNENKPLSESEIIKYRNVSIKIVVFEILLLCLLFPLNHLVALGFSSGQFSAALSLAVAKIIKKGR